MANTYKELKEKQQKEFNKFPIMYAFSKEQFEKGMGVLGLKPTETYKVYSIGGGGFIKKTDSEAFNELVTRFDKEMKDAIANDTTGEGFIYDMFNYELANHEYGYTRELEPTLEVLGLEEDEIIASQTLKHGLKLAISNQND